MRQDQAGDRAKHDNQVLRDAIREFRRSVEITRDVRFQASLRLAARQRASAYVVSFLSLYVIALSLLPNILDLKPYQSQILLACSIVLSVFVIFTSLIDASQNFYHQGELLHQCARKLATVFHSLRNIDIDAGPEAAREAFATLQRDYANALDSCPVNHDSVDYYWERAERPHLFPEDYAGKWRSPTRLHFRFKALFLTFSWAIPHAIALISISLVVYVWVIKSAVPAGGHP